jgi:hypothetical protein
MAFTTTERICCGTGNSSTTPPQVDVCVGQTLHVLLVHGLSRDAERLSDETPAPSVAQGMLDGGVFESVGKVAERDDGRQLVGRAACGRRNSYRIHN